MFVLITYDVNTTLPSGAKRLRQIAGVCKDYGVRVQNSVFECVVTEAQLLLVKNKISSIISSSQDSVRFYILGNKWQRKVDVMGVDNGADVSGELII
jgi:CRISPR-associated protein Cas2